MIEEGPKIHFDKFAAENLWALSSLRAVLFDEFRYEQNPNKLSKTTVSLLEQFDRHMDAAEVSGKIVIVKYTNSAFAKIEEPLFYSQELLEEIKFRGYPVPEGLTEARHNGDWDRAEELLKKLHENMKVYVQSGGKVDKVEFEKITKAEVDTKSSPACKPGPAPVEEFPENAFIRDGDYWRIFFKGKPLPLLSNLNGFGYIAHCLDNPYKTINPLDLHAVINGINGQDIDNVEKTADDEIRNNVGGIFGGDSLSDAQAIRKYQVVLDDLKQDHVVAMEHGSLEEQQDLKEKIDKLGYQLRSSTNYKDEPRNFSDNFEKARSNIAHGIRKARKKISGENEELGEYIEKNITGLSYSPEQSNLIEWIINL
ncbi:MAG: hypothetical protein HN472_18005 [Nitrospina sp.]|jgi:hypothetical protein|nr:hypothetical protein [Nitrospina sp.]